jgi:hypothetical protein
MLDDDSNRMVLEQNNWRTHTIGREPNLPILRLSKQNTFPIAVTEEIKPASFWL